MKKLLLLALLISSCGYESKENKVIGQVKKVINRTPLICINHKLADVSLGVLRNGVGSMSNEDLYFTIQDSSQEKLLKEANESGKLVELTYDVQRITFCVSDHLITNVKVLKN